MFRAVFEDARKWRYIVETVHALVEEAEFKATPDGLRMRKAPTKPRVPGMAAMEATAPNARPAKAGWERHRPAMSAMR